MNEFSAAVVAGIATFPQRANILEECLARIAPQADAVVLYLNEYDAIPGFLAKYRNVHPVLGRDALGDLSAAGKMMVLQHCRDCYIVLLDDDILVPADYIDRIKVAIDRYDGQAAFCVHGTVIAGDAGGYYERSLFFGWRDALTEHKLVTLVGSGTFAVHQSSFPASLDQFLGPVMVDLRVSLICRDNGVPLLSLARPANWMGVNIQEGLWEQFRTTLTHHTHVMRENQPWTFPRFAAIVRTMFERHFGGLSRESARARNFDSEVAAAVIGGWVPPGWGTTALTVATRTQHLRTFGR